MNNLKELFGGAITVALPPTLADASDLRQVPDNQEVFMDVDSDVSWVIEVLEQVDRPGLADAAHFHFDSLAHDNEAENTRVDSIVPPHGPVLPCPPNQPTPVVLSGVQYIRKFNKPDLDEVHIMLALFRISGLKSDVVMTMNVPVTNGGAALSAQPTTLGEEGQMIENEQEWEGWTIAFSTAVQSFQILDFGLFGTGSK